MVRPVSWSSAGLCGLMGLCLVEASSLGVASPSGSGLFGNSEFDGEFCCGAVAEGGPVEITGFVGLAGGGDGPCAAGEFAGYGGVGRDVVVTAFDHEPPVVFGQLGVATPGHVGCLVESEPELGWALFGDPP